MPYSPQERQRRSELARRLHREGKLGGPGPARRSVEIRRHRANRVSELAHDMAIKHADKIEAALLDALKHGTRSQKIKAGETLLKLALAGERLDAVEHKTEAEHHSREELIEILRDKLTSGPAAAIVRARLAEQNGDIIDGQAVEAE